LGTGRFRNVQRQEERPGCGDLCDIQDVGLVGEWSRAGWVHAGWAVHTSPGV